MLWNQGWQCRTVLRYDTVRLNFCVGYADTVRLFCNGTGTVRLFSNDTGKVRWYAV